MGAVRPDVGGNVPAQRYVPGMASDRAGSTDAAPGPVAGPGSTVDVEVERLVAGGESLGRERGRYESDGRVVLMRGGLAGERVRATITEAHRSWVRADIDEVLISSGDRVVPPCPSRIAGCGGCDWMHLAAERQLEAKLEVARDALRRLARLDGTDELIAAGGSVSPFEYRTTIRVIGDADLHPSFRREGSHALVPSEPCRVVHRGLAEILGRIRIEPGVEVTLRVSAATGEATAVWTGRADAVSGLSGHVGTGPEAVIHEVIAGTRLRVSAPSFFQSGPEAAELLVAAVKAAAPELDEARSVVDAYGGVGLFGATTTRRDAHITVVEASRSAAADALVNLAQRSHHVICTDVERWKPDRRRRSEPIDVLIADPARAGLGRRGSEVLAAHRPGVLVLVSCDPAAAARDLSLLVHAGYRLRSAVVLDLFPQTHHVEIVSALERSGRA